MMSTRSDVYSSASSRLRLDPPTLPSQSMSLSSSHPPSHRPRLSHFPKEPLSRVMPPRVALLRGRAPLTDEEIRKHGWNPNDKSSNLYLRRGGKNSEDRLWVRRNNVARSTDAIRGRTGYRVGTHLWEITWDTSQRGTHAVVGVATKDAPLHCDGYRALVGSNAESFGWELRTNNLLHNARPEDDEEEEEGGGGDPADRRLSLGTEDVDNNAPEAPGRIPLNPPRKYPVKGEAPNSFEAVLDFEDGTLAFIVDGEYQGVAFENLKGLELYPVVSCVWGHCEIRLRYLGGLPEQPSTLFDYCKRTIQARVPRRQDLEVLPLPKHILTHLKETHHLGQAQ